MKPKTELLLYHLLWTASKLARPTARKIDEGFEAWSYRNGLLPQIQRLESKGLVESSEKGNRRLVQLTEAGRLAALGGRDPAACWSAKWDGKWRLILFDIPEKYRTTRKQLVRSLAAIRCGCLQKSVWISATTPPSLGKLMQEDGADCQRIVILQAESLGNKGDANLVHAAWNFDAISANYQAHIKVLNRFDDVREQPNRATLLKWSAEENAAWLNAVRSDPLLPSLLLPQGYPGRKAWQRRIKILTEAAQLANDPTVP